MLTKGNDLIVYTHSTVQVVSSMTIVIESPFPLENFGNTWYTTVRWESRTSFSQKSFTIFRCISQLFKMIASPKIIAEVDDRPVTVAYWWKVSRPWLSFLPNRFPKSRSLRRSLDCNIRMGRFSRDLKYTLSLGECKYLTYHYVVLDMPNLRSIAMEKHTRAMLIYLKWDLDWEDDEWVRQVNRVSSLWCWNAI
jgi:hypothetical protein